MKFARRSFVSHVPDSGAPQPVEEQAKKKRDAKRLPQKKADAVKPAQRQQQVVERFADKMDTRTQNPPVPTEQIAPYVIEGRIYTGLIYPLGGSQLVIQGWNTIDFPTQYIDWAKTLIIKRKKKVVLTISAYILRADGLYLHDVEKLLWGYCVPPEFRGFESGQINNFAPEREGKQEIVDKDQQEHLKAILRELDAEELLDQQTMDYPMKDGEIQRLLCSLSKDEPAITLHLNLNDGHYYQLFGGIYYNYDGQRHSAYSWDNALQIRKFKPSSFVPKSVPIVALKHFVRPLPLPKVRIHMSGTTKLVSELSVLFGIDLRLVTNPNLPNIVDLIMGFAGYNDGHHFAFPPEDLLPSTQFSAHHFTISWGLNTVSHHTFAAGGRLVAVICGFPIFRVPSNIMKQPRFKPELHVQLYPNNLSQGWTHWAVSKFLSVAKFPTLGTNKWLWARPRRPGIEVYRTRHSAEKATYIVRFVDPTMPNKDFFIPGWFLKNVVLEVASRNPDRNWMSQVSSLLMKLIGVMNLPSWIVQPLTLALYMDFHERVGGVLLKHLYTYNPQLSAYTDARNQRQVPPKHSFTTWVENGRTWFADRTSNWWPLLMVLLVFVCLWAPNHLIPQHPARLNDAFAAMRQAHMPVELSVDMVLQVFLEEIVKHWLPWSMLGIHWYAPALIMGTIEWWAYGPTGFPNFLLHTMTGLMPIQMSYIVHLAYNYYVLNSNVNWHTACFWEAVGVIWRQTGEWYDKIKYGMQEWYLVPPWSFLGQLHDQAVEMGEQVQVLVFDLPLQFSGAINKWSDYTPNFIPTAPNFDLKFTDPVTGQVNVWIQRVREKFNLEDVDNKKEKTLDERMTQAGTVLYGMGFGPLLPRRQQSLDINSWVSLLEYRLKRTNTYSVPFKSAVWKQASLFCHNKIKYRKVFKDMEDTYGLKYVNGSFLLELDAETDARRRVNMLKHFDGPKKKDYLDGYDKLFERVVISNDFPWPKNYSLIMQHYRSKMTTISLAHKRDELLLKKGDIKPRPIFSVPLLTRALTGPFLWAFKQSVYMNNYPFHFDFEDFSAYDMLNDYSFLRRGLKENLVREELLAMGATPLEISLWITLQVIRLSASLEPKDWLKILVLWADGNAYDLSGVTVDHLLFSKILESANVPAEVAALVADFVASEHTVLVDRLKATIKMANIFQTGMSETTIFNTLRNISSASLTFAKHKIARAQMAGGDDYLALMAAGVTTQQADALIKDFEADQLLMGVTSKCGVGPLPRGDFYSSLLVPALTVEGHEVIVLTLKIGKLLKSGASHSNLAHTNPWDVLYDTSFVWEKVTRHLPVANAIARFHKRLAIAKGGRKIVNETLIGNPNLDWRDPSTLKFYKALRPSALHDRFMFERYGLTYGEMEEFIEFMDELPMQTVIVNHPVLKKIAAIDLE